MTLVEDLRLGQQQIVEIARALSVEFAHPDHGRADLGAERDRGGGAVQGDPRSDQPRRVDRLYLASSRRGAADHRLRRRAARRRDHGDGRGAATSTSNGSCATWSARISISVRRRPAMPSARSRLSIDDVSVADASGSDSFVVDRMSLDVRAGEIVCIYGLMGAGRTELLECVAGRVPMVGGRGSAGRRGHLQRSASPSASPRVSRWCPRIGSATVWCRPCRVGENLSLASIGAFATRRAAVLHARAGDGRASPSATSTSRRPAAARRSARCRAAISRRSSSARC